MGLAKRDCLGEGKQRGGRMGRDNVHPRLLRHLPALLLAVEPLLPPRADDGAVALPFLFAGVTLHHREVLVEALRLRRVACRRLLELSELARVLVALESLHALRQTLLLNRLAPTPPLLAHAPLRLARAEPASATLHPAGPAAPAPATRPLQRETARL